MTTRQTIPNEESPEKVRPKKELPGKAAAGKAVTARQQTGSSAVGSSAAGSSAGAAKQSAGTRPGGTGRLGAKSAAVVVTTPWGPSAVVEEVKVAQQAGDRRFATIVQLLESKTGEMLVRVAYTTDGIARRGPVTLRPRDVERLNALLGARPRLAEALARGGGAT